MWTLTSLHERLVKTGTRLVRPGRYVIFQIASAALPRKVFAGIIGLINSCAARPRETLQHDWHYGQIRATLQR